MTQNENDTDLMERLNRLASPVKEVHDRLKQMATAQLLTASADNRECENIKQMNDVTSLGDALVDACNPGHVFESLTKNEKTWLIQVIYKYTDAENNFQNNSMPVIKDSLVDLLLLQSEARRAGRDVTPLDLLLPVSEMQCAAGTKSEFVFKSATLRGGDDVFFADLLGKQARKFVELGLVSSGNEKHIPTALMYILGLITEEQALQFDDLYYFALPLPAHLCFEVLGELFKHYGINEKLKTIANNRKALGEPDGLQGVNTTSMYEEAGEIANVIASLSTINTLELNTTLFWQYEDTEQTIADEQVAKSIISPISYQDIQRLNEEQLNELPGYLKNYFKTILQRCGRHSLNYSHYHFQERILEQVLTEPDHDIYSDRLSYIVDTLFAMKLGLIEGNNDIEDEILVLKMGMEEKDFKNFGVNRYISHIASLPEAEILNNFKPLLEGYFNFEPNSTKYEKTLSMTIKLITSVTKLGRVGLAKTLIDQLIESDYSYTDKNGALGIIINKTFKKQLFYYYDNADICNYAFEQMVRLSKEFASIDALNDSIGYFNKVFINNPKAALDAFKGYGIDINKEYGSRDKSLLHYAVDYGDIAACERLIDEFGIDLNGTTFDRSWTPLHMACDNKNLAMARLLLEKGADYKAFGKSGEKPIHLASARGSVAIVELLYKSGCNLNFQESSKLLTPLHIACKKSHSDVIDFLLNNGASAVLPDTKGRTALHLACREGDIDICEKLLPCMDDIDMRDKNNFSALQYACSERNADVVKLLLDYLKANQQEDLYAYQIVYPETNPCLTKPGYGSVVITDPTILSEIENAITPANQNVDATTQAEQITDHKQHSL